MPTPQNNTSTWERMITAIPKAAVGWLDTLLRRVQGVYEFTDAQWCLLRIATARSPRDITLSDGVHVAKGELIGALHLWNEHVPPMPPGGADLSWGVRAYSLLVRSFRLLAQHSTTDPKLGKIRAWYGESSFLPKGMGVPDVLIRLGFDVVRGTNRSNYWQKFVDFWESFYWWMLTWAFQPASLRSKDLFKLKRWEVWISTAKLQDKYGRQDYRPEQG